MEAPISPPVTSCYLILSTSRYRSARTGIWMVGDLSEYIVVFVNDLYQGFILQLIGDLVRFYTPNLLLC